MESSTIDINAFLFEKYAQFGMLLTQLNISRGSSLVERDPKMLWGLG